MQSVYSPMSYKEYLTQSFLNKKSKLEALKREKKRDGTYYTPVVQALIKLEEGVVERLGEKVLWME